MNPYEPLSLHLVESVGFKTFLIFMALRVVLLLMLGGLPRRALFVWGTFAIALIAYCAPQLEALFDAAASGADLADGVAAQLQGKLMGGALAALAGTILCQNLGLE
ncbi:hypothetical protein [Chitinasiproducens palmae]|uniref:Uncharacterized protein n=1 Tax=Chitinasiproducens palmae TaxID=1770053 RepID=A0A1H2PV22_9BURK|nr:hypothetical protein [Chitinasiproducens palmae]SDV51106.1 hypothetical protein SAMN05216551_11527 [Chitinasiproducens palmae]